MFGFVVVLSLASTALELMLAAKIPSWRKSAFKYKLINLTFSVLLSFFLGIMFGAAGLIVMTAAVVSTILSIPGYKFLHWNYDSSAAQQRGGNQYKYFSTKWKQVFSDFMNLLYKIFRVITFPIWGFRLVYQKYSIVKNKILRRT